MSSPGGQFDIYNHAGTVNVLVDINGYYVDHDHDDRYVQLVDQRTSAIEPMINVGSVRGDLLISAWDDNAAVDDDPTALCAVQFVVYQP